MKNGNLEASDSTQKNDTPWHGRDPITPPLCRRFWNWSMWPCVASSWQLMRKVPWNENESKTNKRRRRREEGETACFYCCTSQKGKQIVFQLSISLKNTIVCCFVFISVLASTMKLGCSGRFGKCLVKVDFVQRFFVCFFLGLIGRIIGI